ncbi:MAG: hypothetical protein KA831_07780 [Pyrinomonadaceae bacterium]|nr:hypothetical protein [Pyrinomonadaceae bacterium]
MNFKTIFVLLLLVVTCPIYIFTQVVDKDREDALKLALKFSRRMQQTQDIRPLINEFFVEDAIKNSSKADTPGFYLFVESDLEKQIDRDLQHKFFVAGSNWSYLVFAYIYSKTTAPFNDEFDITTAFPLDVKRQMRKNPSFLVFRDKSMYDADIRWVKTEKELRTLVKDLEKINALYRNHLGSLKRMSSQKYDAIWNKGEKSLGKLFDVSSLTCDSDDNCFGLRLGTKVMKVTVIPFFQLHVSRINGQMKVLSVTNPE